MAHSDLASNQDDELSETYDQNGNVLSSGGKSFGYDAENHLISMNGSAVSIVYDGDGNRVAKTVNGVTTKYLVDYLNPTGYAQGIDELTNGAVTRTYTYGLQRISQYQFVSSSNTWTPSFYGYEGFGNVRNLTSSADNGAVTDTYDYDAFGNKINSTGTTPNNYLYRGEQFDPDLGLYYLRARYYNPQIGRFLSEDPIGFAGGINKYVYVSDAPMDFDDPFGTDKQANCRGKALRSLAFHGGLDALSAIPGVGLVTAGVQIGIASANTDWADTSPAGQAAQGTSIFGGVVGFANLFEMGTGIISKGLPSLAEALPGVGVAVGVVSVGLDAYSAYGQYKSCMAAQ